MIIQINTQALIAILTAIILVCGTVGYLGGRYYTMVGYVLVETSANESAVDMYDGWLAALTNKYKAFQPQLVTPEEPNKEGN